MTTDGTTTTPRDRSDLERERIAFASSTEDFEAFALEALAELPEWASVKQVADAMLDAPRERVRRALDRLVDAGKARRRFTGKIRRPQYTAS